jgi:hypothetical protein
MRADFGAKSLITIGGPHPSATEKRLATRLTSGRIDPELYRSLSDTLTELTTKFREAAPLVDEIDPLAWESLGRGAHRRKTHIEPSKEDAQ